VIVGTAPDLELRARRQGQLAADGNAADAVIAQLPEIRDFARAGRGFLARAIGFLAGAAGVRQFLDLGTGLPAADNSHELAQRIAPSRGSSTSTTTRWCWSTPGRC